MVFSHSFSLIPSLFVVSKIRTPVSTICRRWRNDVVFHLLWLWTCCDVDLSRVSCQSPDHCSQFSPLFSCVVTVENTVQWLVRSPGCSASGSGSAQSRQCHWLPAVTQWHCNGVSNCEWLSQWLGSWLSDSVSERPIPLKKVFRLS